MPSVNKRNPAAEKPIPVPRKLEEEEKSPEYMPMITVMLATFGMMMKVCVLKNETNLTQKI